MAAAVMFVFAIIPGFPWFVFAPLGLAVLGASFWIMKKNSAKEQNQGFVSQSGQEDSTDQEMTPGAMPLMLAVGSEIPQENIVKSLHSLRWNLFENLGLPIPEIQIQMLKNGKNEDIELFLYQEPILTLHVPRQTILALAKIED